MKFTASFFLLFLTLLASCNINRVDTRIPDEITRDDMEQRIEYQNQKINEWNQRQMNKDFKENQIMSNPNLTFDQRNKALSKLSTLDFGPTF